MQLKSIKASGFKSFADKIDIDVGSGITGIVGPNGSGKSNVVDAVKWVLGEQSLKALRGSNQMTDVIFQGSASRKPMTRASVTLVFDNSDHYLNSDYQEIEIKRIVYSSGENEYLLNNNRVRLKDITDLFLDSGAGKEAFSIISQGKIGEILNGKPDDRRTIIEEAAGVLKYKKRKVESLKKLDHTNDNLSKVDLVINELSTTLEPLRGEAEKAREYKDFKTELESIEIALLVNDIRSINGEYESLKEKEKELKEFLDEADRANTLVDSNIERIKLELLKVDGEINNASQKLLKVTEELSSLDANKKLISERKKYEIDDVKLAANIMSLKESIAALENQLKVDEESIQEIKAKIEEASKKKADIEVDLKKELISKSNLVSELDIKTRLKGELENKIDIMIENLENDTLVPSSIRSVLSNPRLKGLHGTLGSLITIEPTYSTAIDTLLGSMQNVVIADNESAITPAINYLKENRLGRVTFFPLDVIKARYVDSSTLDIAKSYGGFIDIASNLTSYDKIYENVVKNQLGNALVVKDLDTLNHLGKAINYTYRIVSLDGEILHTGGSITGGSFKQNKNTISEKNRLETSKRELKLLEEDIERKKSKIDEISKEEDILRNEKDSLDSLLFSLSETLKNRQSTLEARNRELETKRDELKGTIGVQKDTLDAELDEVINKYYAKEQEKNSLNITLESLRSHKDELNTDLSERELKSKKTNSEYNKKASELNDIEVNLGKMDIQLDNLLLRLNEEYNMTYEKARDTYEVPSDIESTRERVQVLRKHMKNLGDVNLGAIEEFDRINTRYEFLTGQRQDLKNSIENILGVINEMDETMERIFKETFDSVNREFKSVFAQLFKGGHGELVLTEPLNLLETGVDIIAEPPGKKLKNITLLSGGEKTLTAIALLFAILNVKTVPFCILDEVEAALDEANVDAFGNYLKKYEDKTQFIVITHKKKTMEYASTLYGITMQESGVSKLVSVKLEDR